MLVVFNFEIINRDTVLENLLSENDQVVNATRVGVMISAILLENIANDKNYLTPWKLNKRITKMAPHMPLIQGPENDIDWQELV